jgi:hypothetical protein
VIRPLFHLLMHGPIMMDLDPTCSWQEPLQIFLVPEVSTQILSACMDPRPLTPWEASLAVWTKGPVVTLLVCVPRSWATVWQPRGQKCLLSLPFPANAPEMWWEMARETKSLRPLCSNQGFYYGSRLRGDNFSKPWAPISIRRWVIYSPGGLCNKGVFVVYGSVTRKQIVYRICSPTPL